MKTINLNIGWKSSDAEYDDNIDFIGVRLVFSPEDIKRIEELQKLVHDNKDVIMLTANIGDFQFIKDEDIDYAEEATEDTVFTQESEYRHSSFELKIFKSNIYPAMQSKYNASNEIEFEAFWITDGKINKYNRTDNFI
ncbi:MAG: hypothetical protein F6K19_01535 [Cyanothece sp. SIO1E1]|nr:hypothetical protein [Cyanothece sp. SIO1E1]